MQVFLPFSFLPPSAFLITSSLLTLHSQFRPFIGLSEFFSFLLFTFITRKPLMDLFQLFFDAVVPSSVSEDEIEQPSSHEEAQAGGPAVLYCVVA
ncbi:hypothetical protein PIIN_05021 [Serendipita indica DSM 11827]|uniref:Uncharacterized protein n=1 Tax=Serendipita indica (strain DSM 11827) TaxID=1109443 RepID=G4TID6_SERID|nr:hypothetical protein PIIN_05021 [Serendipita indica DSM 11827]